MSHKLLVLGGKPIGSCELVKYAKAQGDYVVVADYLAPEASPAKRLADESWDASTADVDDLCERCREQGIDSVLSGVHEFNLDKMARVAQKMGYPCYCTPEQFDALRDKGQFKTLCQAHGIPTARRYSYQEAQCLPESAYPLAVKPLDGSGSRGFSKVANPADLDAAVDLTRSFSFAGDVVIEDFIDGDAVIIHYTAHQGSIVYSGIADKCSQKMGDAGAPIMALQIAPSRDEQKYLDELNDKAIALFKDMGITEGPLWIEAFNRNGSFLFNEMGFRFGGSLTYHLVREMYGIDQLAALYACATGSDAGELIAQPAAGAYAIWPLHLKPGVIDRVCGVEDVLHMDGVVACVQVHGEGDTIEQWGSAQQVFAYVHVKADDAQGLLARMRQVKETLSVLDTAGNQMLFSLFDPSDQDEYPSFLRDALVGAEA